MVERYKRGKGKRHLLGSHAKCWIWGRNLVQETLDAGRWPMLDLFLSDSLPADAREQAVSRAAALGFPVKVVPPEELEKLGHTREHQGYLARMQDFPYAALDDLLSGGESVPFFVILDGIQDPYNLGAILRSAEVFGAHGAILQETGQVGITSMVARSSAGAVNRIPVAQVESLDEAAAALAKRGVALIGASEKAQQQLPACNLAGPVCIVIGNEGVGMRPGLQARCTALVKIPQHGHVGSLNAAVAAGIFFYEVRRQRG